MTTITTEDTTDSAQDEEPLHGPNIILDVENFGPIAEAKGIEFRPMTVFVGPSNTGKSYLAMLLHAILKAKHGDIFNSEIDSPTVAHDQRFMESFDPVEFMSEVRNQVDSGAVSDSANDRPYIHVDTLSPGSQKVVWRSVDTWLLALARGIEKSIRHYFQVGRVEELQRHGCHRGRMSIALSDGTGDWDSDVMDKSSRLRFVDLELILTRLALSDVHTVDLSRSLERRRSFRQASSIIDLSVSSLIDSFPFSVYLPASRSGILASLQVLAEAIVASMDQLDLDPREVKQFNPIARELLRLLIRDARARMTRRFSIRANELAETVEESLLHGRIFDRGEGSMPDQVSYFSDGREFAIDYSSSMVTELAPVVLLLRKVLRIGDLIIIDEPESHLHPEAQQTVAALLTVMVRRGFRVLITTHSHYIVEAMGMFVNSGEIEESVRSTSMSLMGDDLDRDLYLSESEVSVYGFTPRASLGSVVAPIHFDQANYAYNPVDYGTALANQANRISRVLNRRVDADELVRKA